MQGDESNNNINQKHYDNSHGVGLFNSTDIEEKPVDGEEILFTTSHELKNEEESDTQTEEDTDEEEEFSEDDKEEGTIIEDESEDLIDDEDESEGLYDEDQLEDASEELYDDSEELAEEQEDYQEDEEIVEVEEDIEEVVFDEHGNWVVTPRTYVEHASAEEEQVQSGTKRISIGEGNNANSYSERMGDRSSLRDIISSGESAYRGTIYNADGNPIERQVEGSMYIATIQMHELILAPSSALERPDDIENIESLISEWGLIQPLHVLKFRDMYMVIHGKRRLKALRNLGYTEVPCLVDETRPKETAKFLEAILHNTGRRYSYTELLRFSEFIETNQETFNFSSIDKMLGLTHGDTAKAKYIQGSSYPDIIENVAMGKWTISDGFKKLIKKEEKDALSDPFEAIRSEDDSLTDADNDDPNVQRTGEREPLPLWLSRQVEARDHGHCQSCGTGYNKPELVVLMKKHHIVPVHQKGADSLENLILLCSNCHDLVHSFERGTFKIPKGNEEFYFNIIILGNIIKKGIPSGTTAYDVFKQNSKEYWLD
jgi:hypothetical protein